jgi:hypothetical protein
VLKVSSLEVSPTYPLNINNERDSIIKNLKLGQYTSLDVIYPFCYLQLLLLNNKRDFCTYMQILDLEHKVSHLSVEKWTIYDTKSGVDLSHLHSHLHDSSRTWLDPGENIRSYCTDEKQHKSIYMDTHLYTLDVYEPWHPGSWKKPYTKVTYEGKRENVQVKKQCTRWIL